MGKMAQLYLFRFETLNVRQQRRCPTPASRQRARGPAPSDTSPSSATTPEPESFGSDHFSRATEAARYNRPDHFRSQDSIRGLLTEPGRSAGIFAEISRNREQRDRPRQRQQPWASDERSRGFSDPEIRGFDSPKKAASDPFSGGGFVPGPDPRLDPRHLHRRETWRRRKTGKAGLKLSRFFMICLLDVCDVTAGGPL